LQQLAPTLAKIATGVIVSAPSFQCNAGKPKICRFSSLRPEKRRVDKKSTAEFPFNIDIGGTSESEAHP